MNTQKMLLAVGCPSGHIHGYITGPECLWPIGTELKFGTKDTPTFFVEIKSYDVDVITDGKSMTTGETTVYGVTNASRGDGAGQWEILRKLIEHGP